MLDAPEAAEHCTGWGALHLAAEHQPDGEERARELDGELRRLVGSAAPDRLRLGRLAATFRISCGCHALGFSSIGDYARERLGLSGREMHDLATVSERLERLPALGAAFLGGKLPWSHVRLLARVATPEDEVRWIERVEGLTVRALVALLRSDALPAGVREAADEESDHIEGERTLRFEMRVPTEVASLWRGTLELGRRMLGQPGPVWKIVDAMVGESLSSDPRVIEDWDVDEPRVAPTSDDEPERKMDAFPDVDWAASRRPITARRADSSPASTDPFELDRRMREIVGGGSRREATIGALLRTLRERRFYRSLGFPSFDRYVRERLGVSVSKARALLAIARRVERAPVARAAYESGTLSWVRALTLLPVLEPRFEAKWVDRASAVTVRGLEDQVEWALETRRGSEVPPPGPGWKLQRGDLQTCAQVRDVGLREVIRFAGPASVVQLFRTLVVESCRPGEPLWRGLERLLRSVGTEWASQPRHRDPIFERDGWRCMVPCCGARRELEDHHIRFRSQGGTNDQSNRVALCSRHHHLGIHAGFVHASGRAPGAIAWELGVRPRGEPLLRLFGDTYAASGDADGKTGTMAGDL